LLAEVVPDFIAHAFALLKIARPALHISVLVILSTLEFLLIFLMLDNRQKLAETISQGTIARSARGRA
jgi:hypothetical protein